MPLAKANAPQINADKADQGTNEQKDPLLEGLTQISGNFLSPLIRGISVNPRLIINDLGYCCTEITE